MTEGPHTGSGWFGRAALPLMLLASFVLPARAQRAVFWEPYAPDGQTTVLCHFDRREQASAAALSDGAAEREHPGLLIANEEPGGGGRTTPSDVFLKGSTVPLLGACEEVAGAGRFGGGLRLAGKDGRVSVKGKPYQGWALEGWFKAAGLPKERATLVELCGAAPPLRVSLLADGRLAVVWMNQKEPALPDWHCTAGTWFHLALSWRPARIEPSGHWSYAEMLVLVNGSPILRSGEQRVEVFSDTLAQPISVGNDAKGGSGFDGWLDELRLSSVAREYYSLDLDWVDASGARPAPTGRPYFRDERDLLLWLPFDGTLAPARAPDGAKLAAGTPMDASALAENGKGWGFRFADGVAKQGLLLVPGDKSVQYGRVGALARQGTIAFWSRPQNWDNEKQWNRVAVRLQAPEVFGPGKGGSEPVST